MTAPITIALNALKSDRCACLRKKQPRQSFCSGCYHALPKEHKANLYKGISDGYALHYADSVKWLRENTDRLLNAPKED